MFSCNFGQCRFQSYLVNYIIHTSINIAKSLRDRPISTAYAAALYWIMQSVELVTMNVQSAGAEWLETPGNCLAASISQQNTWVVLTPSGVVEIPVEGHIDESEDLQPSIPSTVSDHETSSQPGAIPRRYQAGIAHPKHFIVWHFKLHTWTHACTELGFGGRDMLGISLWGKLALCLTV